MPPPRHVDVSKKQQVSEGKAKVISFHGEALRETVARGPPGALPHTCGWKQPPNKYHMPRGLGADMIFKGGCKVHTSAMTHVFSAKTLGEGSVTPSHGLYQTTRRLQATVRRRIGIFNIHAAMMHTHTATHTSILISKTLLGNLSRRLKWPALTNVGWPRPNPSFACGPLLSYPSCGRKVPLT